MPPIYDYECCKCHKIAERFSPADSKVPEACECGYSMHRLMPAPKAGRPGFRSKAILSSGEKVTGSFGTMRKKGRET
jgi:hypothetical protein